MSTPPVAANLRIAARLLSVVLMGLAPALAGAVESADGRLLGQLPEAGRADPFVELVTIGPDRAIDTRFGHSLLRLVDAESGTDDVYDFGVADIERPRFIAEAAMGRARFRLQRFSARVHFNSDVFSDRQIDTQRLNLTHEQIAHLLELLESNLLPGNAEYTYDDVADNCSIRLRDLLNDATGGAVQRAAYEIRPFRTYREDILVAGSGRIFALIAYDLFTGPRGEDRVRAWQLSFAPEQLRGVLAAAENPALGDGTPLVAHEAVLQRRSAAPAVGGSVRIGRQAIVAIGAVLGLLFGFTGVTTWRTRGGVRWLSRLAGLVLIPTAALFGVLGFALLPISLFSTATLWSHNQNAWLFFPLDLLLLVPAVRWVGTGRSTLASWSRIYIDLRFLMVVISWTGIVAPQDNSAFALAVALTLIGLRTQPLKEG